MKKAAKLEKVELPIKRFATKAAWEKWLHQHAADPTGIWMQFAKKASSLKSVGYQEALEIALCYGWIDGQVKRYDVDSWLQKFTPRGPKSVWSKINREKVNRLSEEGRMQPTGLAAVERAKTNGQWDAAYDSPSTAAPSEDFLKALNKKPKAKAFFETLNSRNRYAILYRIQTAKKPETRTKRIEQFVDMLQRQEKLYP